MTVQEKGPTIFTVRELIFHDWYPTNPGSELGMSKSMTKTDKSYRAVCVCVCACNITSYPEIYFECDIIACQLFEYTPSPKSCCPVSFCNSVSSPFLGSGGQC